MVIGKALKQNIEEYHSFLKVCNRTPWIKQWSTYLNKQTNKIPIDIAVHVLEEVD